MLLTGSIVAPKQLLPYYAGQQKQQEVSSGQWNIGSLTLSGTPQTLWAYSDLHQLFQLVQNQDDQCQAPRLVGGRMWQQPLPPSWAHFTSCSALPLSSFTPPPHVRPHPNPYSRVTRPQFRPCGVLGLAPTKEQVQIRAHPLAQPGTYLRIKGHLAPCPLEAPVDYKLVWDVGQAPHPVQVRIAP